MYWTKRRWAALAVHGALAMLLLIWSISSSLHFWSYAFHDAIYAYAAVVCIDGLALLGFMLYVARIDSPLVHIRHALPIVSALPLIFDMHKQFSHLDSVYAVWSFTIGITAMLVALSFIVWRTIERQFISPVEAAQEYAEAQMQTLRIRNAQFKTMQHAVDEFIGEQRLPVVYARPAETPTMKLVDNTAQSLPVVDDALKSYAWTKLMQENAVHEPMHGNDAHSIMHDDAMHDDALCSDAINALSMDRNELASPTDTYQCAKCAAIVPLSAGKDAVGSRKASGRWGCSQCRSK